MRILISLFFTLHLFSASAQLNDSFNDGNFTTNPVWAGDVSEFVVNSSQQLQSNNTVAAASYLSTSLPLASLDDIQWEFYIRQNFSPSASNYSRVYLCSDQSDLEMPLNGYYVQFGEGGSNDAIELFRLDGTVSTSVARGTNSFIAAAFIIRVKVTRDNAGNWNLLADASAGNTYTIQASGNDMTYTTSQFFGVQCVYTVSNANNFYFDDFIVSPIVADTIAPLVQSISVISSTQIDVLFSEAVDSISASDVNNYDAQPFFGPPTIASRDMVNHSLVHVTYGMSFISGQPYTLYVNGVEDLIGNPSLNATGSFTYIAPVTAVYGDIQINEIFADPLPSVSLPVVEYIELYNRSNKTFQLQNWIINDGTNKIIGNAVLFPDEYIILCSPSDVAMFTPFGNAVAVSSALSLTNSGEFLQLFDDGGIVIDSVTYSDSWYQDIVKKDGGWSLEKINPELSVLCEASSNWIASQHISGGTPAQQNSVYNIAIDTTAPQIINIQALDSVHIQVCITEPLLMPAALQIANYAISNGIGNPVSVSAVQNNCYVLQLSNPLSDGISYNILLSNMSDCSGNAVLNVNNSFTYWQLSEAIYGDVVLTEIMADPDPAVQLPVAEYIELYNRSAKNISLLNWTFSDDGSVAALPAYNLLPGEYVLICHNTVLPLFSSVNNIIGVSTFPGLNNDADNIELRNSNGQLIQRVEYTDNWYRDNFKKNGGWSLEVLDVNYYCENSDNWKASSDSRGGTPGILNSEQIVFNDLKKPILERAYVHTPTQIQLYFSKSMDPNTVLDINKYSIGTNGIIPLSVVSADQLYRSIIVNIPFTMQPQIIYSIGINGVVYDCPGNQMDIGSTVYFALPDTVSVSDVLINEVLFNPGENGVDFVELYNRSNRVFDLKSLLIGNADFYTWQVQNEYIIAPEGYLFFPGQFVLISSNSSAVFTDYPLSNSLAFLQIQTMPSYNNDQGVVTVRKPGQTVIDQFAYTEDLHYPLLNSVKGVSLERLSYARPTQGSSNWHSAAETVGFATPGYKNSQHSNAEGDGSEIKVVPEVFSPDNDGYQDYINVFYQLAKPGLLANVTIHDVRGRIIRKLIRNELIGNEGSFTWDGFDDDKTKARIGIYIIVTELIDQTGSISTYKNTCTLASPLD